MGGVKKALRIASPSKLFRDMIGKNLALGIEEGFSSEMKNVVRDMKSAIPTDFNFEINPVVNGNLSTTTATAHTSVIDDAHYMMAAFQKALTGMAFKIDGDKVGEMVISKVERVIFA